MHGLDGGRLSSALRLITAIRGQGRMFPADWARPGHSEHRALLLDDALPLCPSRFRLPVCSLFGTSYPFRGMPYDPLAADDKHTRRSYATGYIDDGERNTQSGLIDQPLRETRQHRRGAYSNSRYESGFGVSSVKKHQIELRWAQRAFTIGGLESM
jgi:hypothetical protein